MNELHVCFSMCTGTHSGAQPALDGSWTAVNIVLAQVGIGAFVLNSKREVLVVQERFGPLKGTVSILQNSLLRAIMPSHANGVSIESSRSNQ